MSVDPSLSRAALGPVTGAATFLLLAGGRIPRTRPRPLGRAAVARWLTLGAIAGLEEVVWRGAVLGGLLVVVGPWAALGASSAAFALWHWPFLRSWCAVHLVTGAAFGCAFLVGGLVAAILGHVLYNLLVDWAVHAERARLRGP
ncbi:MAG: lysostaphin resistance A-like protein [Verrucomicrobiota bacterium]